MPLYIMVFHSMHSKQSKAKQVNEQKFAMAALPS